MKVPTPVAVCGVRRLGRSSERRVFRFAAVLTCAMAGRGIAQSFSYTDGCANRLASSDEDLVEQAYLAAYRYQDRMWEEIDVDGGRPATPDPCERGTSTDVICPSFQQQRCYYSEVPDKHRDKWTEAMDHVKVNCDGSKCAKAGNSNLYGFCGLAAWDIYPSDKILVCVDNIRIAAYSLNKGISAEAVAAGTFAKLAGTISHEIMHQADGFEGHPTGSTDYLSPNTSAESVGVAMEHILLSPDLSASIRSIEVTWNGSIYEVLVAGTLSNLNEYSGPVGTVPFSGRVRNNTDARLVFYLDGAPLAYHYEAPLAGGDSADFSYSFEIEPEGGNGLHEFKIATDDLNNIWELDEENNETTKTFSIATDLAVDVEIAGSYSSGSKTTSNNGVLLVSAYRRLTYNVTVTNRADSLTSPPAALLIQYDDMWRSGATSSVSKSISALEPGAAETQTFSVDVPVTVLGGVTGVTDVYFTVDPDEVLADSERDNNSVHLAIDSAYFKPDYRISLDSLTVDGTNATAAYTVKNIGPEPGAAYSWVGFYLNGSLASSRLTSKLGVASSVSASLSTSFVGLGNLGSRDVSFTFLVKADRTSMLTESNEDNNTAAVTITVPGVTLFQDLERDDGWTTTAVAYGDIERFIPESANTIFSEVFGGMDAASWYFTIAGNGPFLPDVTYDVASQVLIMTNVYSIQRPVVYIVGR